MEGGTRNTPPPGVADDIRWLSRNGWKGTQDSDGIVHELRLVDYTACGVQHRDFVEVPRVVGHDMDITGMWSPFAIQTRAGWPTRSLSDERWRRWSGTRQWKHSYSARFPNLFGFFPPVENATVPLRPIWPGFAINTIFYAAILWMLWLSPFVVRRVIRRKRGHCIKCGYDLRGAEHEVCPECGS